MIIVSDTSPLCNLALVDCLWILQPIYQTVIIPQIVAHELRQARSLKIQTIPTLEWIEIRPLTDTALAETLERDRLIRDAKFRVAQPLYDQILQDVGE